MALASMTMQRTRGNNKILVFIDQMQIGGAARVTSLMLEALADEFNIVIAYDDIKYSTFYHIDERIKRVSYHTKRLQIPVVSGVAKELCLAYKARAIIQSEKPDIIIAVTHLVFSQVYIGNIGLNTPIIAYDHTSFSRNLGVIQNFIRRRLYKRAHKVILLTEKDRNLMSSTLTNTCVVYNPLTFRPTSDYSNRENWVLCVSRLNSWHVKGLDRIISMWGKISSKAEGWRLVIAGGGSEENLKTLANMADAAGVGDSITFLGQVNNMKEVYQKSAIFALPSRVEGFPMSLLEALSQGCPFVSFSLEGAINEMTTNMESGFIVEDNNEELFHLKLIELINSPEYRVRMSKMASQSVERFNTQTYSETLKRIINDI